MFHRFKTRSQSYIETIRPWRNVKLCSLESTNQKVNTQAIVSHFHAIFNVLSKAHGPIARLRNNTQLWPYMNLDRKSQLHVFIALQYQIHYKKVSMQTKFIRELYTEHLKKNPSNYPNWLKFNVFGLAIVGLRKQQIYPRFLKNQYQNSMYWPYSSAELLFNYWPLFCTVLWYI